jgi:hypothetical protein
MPDIGVHLCSHGLGGLMQSHSAKDAHSKHINPPVRGIKQVGMNGGRNDILDHDPVPSHAITLSSASRKNPPALKLTITTSHRFNCAPEIAPLRSKASIGQLKVNHNVAQPESAGGNREMYRENSRFYAFSGILPYEDHAQH